MKNERDIELKQAAEDALLALESKLTDATSLKAISSKSVRKLLRSMYMYGVRNGRKTLWHGFTTRPNERSLILVVKRNAKDVCFGDLQLWLVLIDGNLYSEKYGKHSYEEVAEQGVKWMYIEDIV